MYGCQCCLKEKSLCRAGGYTFNGPWQIIGCKKVGTVAKFSVKGKTVIPDQGKCLPTAPSLLSEGHLAGHLRKLRLPASVFPKDL